MMKKIMTGLLTLSFIVSSLLLVSSCAKKQIQTVGTGETRMVQPTTSVPSDKEMKDAEAAAAAEAAEMAKAHEKFMMEMKTFESTNIYFDFDSSELKPEARVVLTAKAGWLRDNSEYKVKIEGHCDERGTNEYNLALGERRADAAAKFLNALGVSGDRINTISYGEERPAVSGSNDEAWAKNRRDEFKLIK